MDTKGLDKEVLEEARAAKSAEDLERVVAKDGMELQDQVLEDLSGGDWGRMTLKCKKKA